MQQFWCMITCMVWDMSQVVDHTRKEDGAWCIFWWCNLVWDVNAATYHQCDCPCRVLAWDEHVDIGVSQSAEFGCLHDAHNLFSSDQCNKVFSSFFLLLLSFTLTLSHTVRRLMEWHLVLSVSDSPHGTLMPFLYAIGVLVSPRQSSSSIPYCIIILCLTVVITISISSGTSFSRSSSPDLYFSGEIWLSSLY